MRAPIQSYGKIENLSGLVTTLGTLGVVCHQLGRSDFSCDLEKTLQDLDFCLAVSFTKAHVSALRLSLSFPVLGVYVCVHIHVNVHADALCLLLYECMYTYM